MDLQAEKLKLIQWLTEIDDQEVIKRLKMLQKSTPDATHLSNAEKAAVDKGMQSVKEGHVRSHEDVMRLTKEKYPHLFEE